MALIEGRKAPEFELPGSDGKTHTLADYGGKIVVLYFYPRDNTPGCTKEACGFRELRKDLAKAGAVVLGVSKDGLESHDRFIKAFALPFVLLSDPGASTMKAYGAWGEKTMYGKKVTGTIRSTVVIGPDGKVLRHWPSVKRAAEHPAEVLAFLAGR
jgi:thioredoxin-dependent peroxiredoxin